MAYSRQSAAILAPGAHACSTNFSFRLMTRCSFQGTHSEDHCQRCPETFVSAMSWYRTPRSVRLDRKSTRLNSSHSQISYAVFCLKKKKKDHRSLTTECG